VRYPLVGGTRQRHFDGTNSKPRNLLENAATPTSRVHALLGNLYERKTRLPGKDKTAYLTEFYTRLNHWQLAKSIPFGYVTYSRATEFVTLTK
jgi:hypothetical protein